jgi:hypothetical protein
MMLSKRTGCCESGDASADDNDLERLNVAWMLLLLVLLHHCEQSAVLMISESLASLIDESEWCRLMAWAYSRELSSVSVSR